MHIDKLCSLETPTFRLTAEYPSEVWDSKAVIRDFHDLPLSLDMSKLPDRVKETTDCERGEHLLLVSSHYQ